MRLLQACLNRGVCSDTFADIIQEMQSIKYFDDYADREYGIAAEEENGNTEKEKYIF